MSSKPRILVIEDDDLQHEVYEDALDAYELVRVRTGSEALSQLAHIQPDLIVLDHVLDQGEKGLDYLPELKEAVPYVPIIVVSGALEAHEQMTALQGPRRAHYCIVKPVDVHELEETIAIALEECGEAEIVRQFEALERSKRVDAQTLLSRSTDRLSRQTEIRRIIGDSKARPNVSALARVFKVARRTIIRDLQELIRRGELSADIYPKWESGGDIEEE